MSTDNTGDVSIAVRIERFKEALDSLNALDAAVSRLGGGGSGGSSYGGARADPMVTPIATSGSFGGGIPAGYLAPSAPGVSRSYEPFSGQPWARSGSGQGSSSPLTITTSAMVVHATTVVIHAGNVAGGGGASGGGTFGGAGVGPALAPPAPSWDYGSGWGQPRGGFLRNVMGNPTIPGVGYAALNAMPWGMAGLALGAGYMAEWVAGAHYNAQRPTFLAQLGLDTAEMSGRYVTQGERAGTMGSAAYQGLKAAYEANPLFQIPIFGNAARTWWQMGTGQDLERKAAEIEAANKSLDKRKLLYTMTGGGENAYIAPGYDDTLIGVASSLRGLGSRAAATVLHPGMQGTIDRWFKSGSQIYSPSDVLGAYATATGLLQRPDMFRARRDIMSGRSTPEAASFGIMNTLAWEGNYGAISAMRPLHGREATDTWLELASDLSSQRAIGATRIDIARSYGSAASTRAGLFGSPFDLRESRRFDLQSLGEQSKLLGMQYAYGSDLDKARALPELQRVMTEMTAIITNANRELRGSLTGMAGSIAGVSSSIAQRSVMMGVGGVAGFDQAERVYRTSSQTARFAMDEAMSIAKEIRAQGGDPLANPTYLAALQKAEAAQTSAVAAGIGRANVPISIGLRREESALAFSANVLSTVPGTYGSQRGALRGMMGNLERQAQEIESRREAHRQANGGTLSDAEAFEYQQQLQQIGVQQAGVFSQLSYGWESRLRSEVINAPGSFSLVSPGMAYRAAVGAGVRNPHMGSRSSDLPFFMREAALMGSIAGSTGTPEGFGVTAMTGYAGINRAGGNAPGGAQPVKLEGPIKITLEVPLPGGGVQQIPATMSTANLSTMLSTFGIKQGGQP